MRQIDRVEFYITNVCNLTCEGCNRFNNFKFTGWQAWTDYAEDYAHWGSLINIDHKVIMGGEPLLNPTILEWIRGIHSIWPNSANQILTNGTYLDRVDGLLETCRENRTWIGISLHRDDILEEMEEKIKNYLGSINQVNHSRTGQAGPAGGHHYYQNNQGDSITVWDQYHFCQSALIYDGQKYNLHNSNPVLAHNNCVFAQNKNYHFIRGKFYKCGPVALFPELNKQFDLNLDPIDQQLINSYQPLTVDNYNEYNKTFFDTLDNPIEQCKFCPEKSKWQQIYPVKKGSSIKL